MDGHRMLDTGTPMGASHLQSTPGMRDATNTPATACTQWPAAWTPVQSGPRSGSWRSPGLEDAKVPSAFLLGLPTENQGQQDREQSNGYGQKGELPRY
jgi:hypothetical protein